MKRKKSGGTERVPVAQYDLDGNEIEVFKSMKAAELKTGVFVVCISRCVRGERKTAGGFIWKAFELEID